MSKTSERKARYRKTISGYRQMRMEKWVRRGIKIDSYQEYLNILEVQGYRCCICGIHVNGNSDLDHDHTTGKPRGILCKPCNMSLGRLEPYLQQAMNYLEAHERSKSEYD